MDGEAPNEGEIVGDPEKLTDAELREIDQQVDKVMEAVKASIPERLKAFDASCLSWQMSVLGVSLAKLWAREIVAHPSGAPAVMPGISAALQMFANCLGEAVTYEMGRKVPEGATVN